MRALVVGCRPRGERGEGRAHRADVVAQPADGVVAEGDGVAILDVLADLRPEAELEAPAAELGDVPGRIGEEGRAAGEGERHAGADGDPLGVLGDEQRHRHGVVHRLGHVQPVVAQSLHPLRVGDGFGQAEARVHARVDLHAGAPSSPVVCCAAPGDDLLALGGQARLVEALRHPVGATSRASALNASGPLSAPIWS